MGVRIIYRCFDYFITNFKMFVLNPELASKPKSYFNICFKCFEIITCFKITQNFIFYKITLLLLAEVRGMTTRT